jgi:hypothetical protein
MFSVKGGFSGQDRQVYRMPVRPSFHWAARQKKTVWRAPPAPRIVHYRFGAFVTPTVETCGNIHTARIFISPSPRRFAAMKRTKIILILVNNQRVIGLQANA